MEIWFGSARLQKLCNSNSKLRGKYGPRMAGLIQQRLVDLAEVQNLAEMRLLPGRCHELSGDLRGSLAVDLVHPDRLVFKPANDPIPVKEDGGLDWSAVTEIEIAGIGDYH
ncbi:MAG: killer suppression protein [Planctomycetes bacterium RBG_13_63_9]|nr:MAG: killer suppression protein [Planctomycetes bacterium RBG_13_63_9]